MNNETGIARIAASLRSEAETVLRQKGLLRILSEYGAPHVSGSYPLDLMTWRDLDIYLESYAMPEDRFFHLGGQIANALAPSRMQYRNERVAHTEGLPLGLYWGIYFNLSDSQLWKTDIWCVPEDECRRLLQHCSNIQRRLTPETREAILQIKSACWKHPEYRFGFSSQDIYEAVLDHGMRTLEQFREHLEKQKGISV